MSIHIIIRFILSLPFFQMFDVVVLRYFVIVPSANQFWPYACEHVHVEQTEYSALLLGIPIQEWISDAAKCKLIYNKTLC